MQAKLSTTNIKKFGPDDKAYEVVDTEIMGFLMRVQPTGRKTFYFSYRTSAAKRKRIKIGVLGSSTTIAQARDDATVFAGKVAHGIDIQGEKLAGKQKSKDLLQNTLDLFMTKPYKEWAVATLKTGQYTIDIVTRSFPDYLDLPMSEITIKQVEQWRTIKLNAGLKATSINRAVNALRSVLTKAVEWDVIPEHPLAGLKALKVDVGKKARYLTGGEEKRLYKALSERDEDLKGARKRGNTFREARGYELMDALA